MIWSKLCMILWDGKRYLGGMSVFCWKKKGQSKAWKVSSIIRGRNRENDVNDIVIVYKIMNRDHIKGKCCYVSAS